MLIVHSHPDVRESTKSTRGTEPYSGGDQADAIPESKTTQTRSHVILSTQFYPPEGHHCAQGMGAHVEPTKKKPHSRRTARLSWTSFSW